MVLYVPHCIHGITMLECTMKIYLLSCNVYSPYMINSKTRYKPILFPHFWQRYQLTKNTKEVLDMFFWNYYTLCIIRTKLKSWQWIFDSIHKILSKQKDAWALLQLARARTPRPGQKAGFSAFVLSLPVAPASISVFVARIRLDFVTPRANRE